jgi:hypothetical protein
MREHAPLHSVLELMPIHPPAEEPPPSGEGIITPPREKVLT